MFGHFTILCMKGLNVILHEVYHSLSSAKKNLRKKFMNNVRYALCNSISHIIVSYIIYISDKYINFVHLFVWRSYLSLKLKSYHLFKYSPPLIQSIYEGGLKLFRTWLLSLFMQNCAGFQNIFTCLALFEYLNWHELWSV